MLFNNYSQLNMLGMNGYSNMGYTNFLGGGIGLGGYGLGSIFGNGFGCDGYSMFQNCDGSYNYDKMAGMAVGGFLLNLAGGIASNAIAQKQANKTESPNSQIETLRAQLVEKQSESSRLATELNTAKTNYATAKQNYEANQKLLDGKTEADFADAQRICDLYNKKVTPAEGETVPDKNAYNTAYALLAAKDKASSLESAMNTAEAAMKKTEAAKEKADAELAEIKEQIQELEKAQEEEQDSKLFAKADGNIFSKRTGEKELYSRTFSPCSATDADIKGAILLLGKAQKSGNKDTIKKAALKVKEVYDALPDGLRKQYSDSAVAIQRYI